jgi:two-component system, NtrC family, nitrogen regulation response regulator GlnG
LYYRLNGFTIKIPPLRERKQDVLLLLEWFLSRFRKELGKDIHGFSPDALEVLLSYPWPGNVRQLQSVLKQAIVQATGPVLLADFLPGELQSKDARVDEPQQQSAQFDLSALIENRLRAGSHNLYAETLEAMERTLIATVLQNTQGNQSKAAEILGITRGSLRNKIRLLGICIDHRVKLQDNSSTSDNSPSDPVASEV